MGRKKWKNWSLDGVAPSERIPFIIKCLNEYIDEVEEMKEHYECCYPEVIDTQELYKAIVEILSGLQEKKESQIDSQVEKFGEVFKSSLQAQVFTCEVCGRKVYPKVIVKNGGGIYIESNRQEIRGGKGNIVLKRDVCEDCGRRMTLFK